VHDRGGCWRTCAIAEGARVISDCRVMSDPRELFGSALVPSVPTAWRTLTEIAGTGGHGGGPADHRGSDYGARQEGSQNGTTLHQLPQIPGNGGFSTQFSTRRGGAAGVEMMYLLVKAPTGVADQSVPSSFPS
jgi:hypothetical protein